MPTFLFKATTRDGTEVADRVDAADLQAARAVLTARGLQDLRFQDDDNKGAIENFVAELGAPELSPEEWTAADELASRERRSSAAMLWWAFQQHLVIIVPLLLWNVISLVRPDRWRSLDWAGFVATPLYLLYFVLRVAPGVLFKESLRASAWCDWAQVRRIAKLQRMVGWLNGGQGVPETEILIREAYALAFEGRLDDALRWMEERVRPRPNLAETLYLGRLASVYEYARQYDRQIACVREAQAKSKGGAAEWIDLAGALLRRGNDLAGGRAALDRARGLEMSELARAFLQAWDGVAALMAHDPAMAERCLRGALPAFRTGTPLMEIMERIVQAHLCLACVQLGRRDEALALWREARPLLEARRETELLRRCREALAQPARKSI